MSSFRRCLILACWSGCAGPAPSPPASANALAAPAPLAATAAEAAASATQAEHAVHELVIRGGTIHPGGGAAPFVGDLAIDGDRIGGVGPLLLGHTIVDARDLIVAPGFINMLSHADDSLGRDGRALSDVMQGVTLEVFGETAPYPFGPKMQALAARGIAVNIAGLMATSSLRAQLGKPRTAADERREQALVAQALDEGALGLTSALIYTPDNTFDTRELTMLAKVVAQHGGIYAAHIRNEGDRLLEAIDEMLAIARASGVAVEIYHFKQSGKSNWSKLGEAIARIEAARESGLRVSADVYDYDAAATGLDAAMPPWVRAGGVQQWIARLRDPRQRARCAAQILSGEGEWDDFYTAAGPDGIVLARFQSPSLQPLIGETLAQLAQRRGRSPVDTLMDLVIEDRSRAGALYFTMSEANLERELALPWIGFGSDADAGAPDSPPRGPAHPRAFGNFARLLGRYVRDRHAAPLADVLERLGERAAATLHVPERGRLAPGWFADVAVFDPARIADRATYERPFQLATGMVHVLVNGELVVRDGQPTGARPGRFIRRRAP
jgi:N-acyl-D-amino-acid deacylase